MIHSITFQDVTKTPVDHSLKVPILTNGKTFEFKPGLNILFGPNGCGKSTLLLNLARILMCEEATFPCVTWSALGKFRKPVEVALHHDEGPVMYFNPEKEVGVSYGSFVDDFFDEGIVTVLQGKLSSGQRVIARFNQAMNRLQAQKFDAPIEWKGRSNPDSPQVANWKACQKISETTKIRTILLDEPDRSVDIPLAVEFWKFLLRVHEAQKTQVIVASHALFPILWDLPRECFVDLVPGYYDRCVEALKRDQ